MMHNGGEISRPNAIIVFHFMVQCSSLIISVIWYRL